MKKNYTNFKRHGKLPLNPMPEFSQAATIKLNLFLAMLKINLIAMNERSVFKNNKSVRDTVQCVTMRWWVKRKTTRFVVVNQISRFFLMFRLLKRWRIDACVHLTAAQYFRAVKRFLKWRKILNCNTLSSLHQLTNANSFKVFVLILRNEQNKMKKKQIYSN